MPDIINLIITVVMIVVCYILAKKNNMSSAFALLGFFGIVGVQLLPEEDQGAIEAGIHVQTEQELRRLLEDFAS